MQGVIALQKQLGQVRTSNTYAETLRSFIAFREDADVPIDGISSDLNLLYEGWLKAKGVRMNTVSFYMRILRAAYNRVVGKGLTTLCNPFCHVYIRNGQDRQAGYTRQSHQSHQRPEFKGRSNERRQYDKVPLLVVSEGMGYDSETITQIYFATLEVSVVDKANRKIGIIFVFFLILFLKLLFF